MTFEIKTLENCDVSSLTELLPLGWEASLQKIDDYTRSDFCFPVKAVTDNKIVGVGASILHKDVAWLAHIIAHPEYRNQGIGKLITETLVESSRSKNCDTIYLIATALGEPVYRKAGFETETEYTFFKKQKAGIELVHSGNVTAFNSDFKKQVSDLDRQASGEERMCQLEEHLSGGFLYVSGGEVEGFYLPDLGDGLIVAATDAAGEALMALRLKSRDFAAFPMENLGALAFVRQNNFKEIRKERRMRLGKKRSWNPANIYNRIGGNCG